VKADGDDGNDGDDDDVPTYGCADSSDDWDSDDLDAWACDGHPTCGSENTHVFADSTSRTFSGSSYQSLSFSLPNWGASPNFAVSFMMKGDLQASFGNSLSSIFGSNYMGLISLGGQSATSSVCSGAGERRLGNGNGNNGNGNGNSDGDDDSDSVFMQPCDSFQIVTDAEGSIGVQTGTWDTLCPYTRADVDDDSDATRVLDGRWHHVLVGFGVDDKPKFRQINIWVDGVKDRTTRMWSKGKKHWEVQCKSNKDDYSGYDICQRYERLDKDVHINKKLDDDDDGLDITLKGDCNIIGATHDASPAYFNGQIKDVKIYDYESTLCGKTLDLVLTNGGNDAYTDIFCCECCDNPACETASE
jgi:hypothetical protein